MGKAKLWSDLAGAPGVRLYEEGLGVK
jgi:hypothetical protein